MSKANGQHDPNVASLDEARKRAAEAAKAAKREAAQAGGPRTSRDWIIGSAFIAMAIAMIVAFLMGGASTLVGGGK